MDGTGWHDYPCPDCGGLLPICDPCPVCCPPLELVFARWLWRSIRRLFAAESGAAHNDWRNQ